MFIEPDAIILNFKLFLCCTIKIYIIKRKSIIVVIKLNLYLVCIASLDLLIFLLRIAYNFHVLIINVTVFFNIYNTILSI